MVFLTLFFISLSKYGVKGKTIFKAACTWYIPQNYAQKSKFDSEIICHLIASHLLSIAPASVYIELLSLYYR